MSERIEDDKVAFAARVMVNWLFPNQPDDQVLGICEPLARIAIATGIAWDRGERDARRIRWGLPPNKNAPTSTVDGDELPAPRPDEPGLL